MKITYDKEPAEAIIIRGGASLFPSLDYVFLFFFFPVPPSFSFLIQAHVRAKKGKLTTQLEIVETRKSCFSLVNKLYLEGSSRRIISRSNDRLRIRTGSSEKHIRICPFQRFVLFEPRFRGKQTIYDFTTTTTLLWKAEESENPNRCVNPRLPSSPPDHVESWKRRRDRKVSRFAEVARNQRHLRRAVPPAVDDPSSRMHRK